MRLNNTSTMTDVNKVQEPTLIIITFFKKKKKTFSPEVEIYPKFSIPLKKFTPFLV